MTINRRDFLKKAGIATGGGLLASPMPAQAFEYFPGWPERFGALIDTTLCIGCRSCEAACNEVNNLPPPKVSFEDKSVFEKIRRPDAQSFTVVNRFPDPDPGGPPIYVKRQCMHCNEPACASACLVSAFKKTPEAAVIYNQDLCIGCRYCMIACPFSIPAYEYDNAFTPKVRKCTFCYDRITKPGGLPACAEACPVEAITFGKRSELTKLAWERITANPGKYVDHVYGEHEVGGGSWLYLAAVPFDHLGFKTDLGTTPYPTFTRGFLGAVPLVLAIWPAFLMGSYAFSRRRERVARTEDTNQQEEEASS